MAQARKSVSGFGGSLKSAVGGFGKDFLSGLGIGSGFGVAQQLGGLVGGALGFVKDSFIDTNAELEQQMLAFNTILGEERAGGFMDDMKKFAADTPFEFNEVTSAAQKFLAVGMDMGRVLPLLRAVSDNVSAMGGGAGQIQSVTRALFQMKAIGVAQMGEVNQLSEAGIPMLEAIADHMGIQGGGGPDPKKVREAEDKVTDLRNNLIKLGAQRFGPGTAASARVSHNQQVERTKRELAQAQSDLRDLQSGKETGRTAAVREMVEKGQITDEQAIAAYEAYVEKRFKDMSKKQASTWTGAWSTIKDAFKFGIADAFLPAFDLLRDWSVQFSEFTKSESFGAAGASIKEKIAGMVAPFRDLWTLTRNISKDHGLGLFQSALIGIEMKIREAFGEKAAGGFHKFVDAIQGAPGAIGKLGESIGGIKQWLDEQLPGVIASIGTMKDELISGFQGMVAELKLSIGQIVIDLADADIPMLSDKLKPSADRLREELKLPPSTIKNRTNPARDAMTPTGGAGTLGYDANGNPITAGAPKSSDFKPVPRELNITFSGAIYGTTPEELAQSIGDYVIQKEAELFAQSARESSASPLGEVPGVG